MTWTPHRAAPHEEPSLRHVKLLSGSDDAARSTSERPMRTTPELPAFQTRTCARCGRRTTFALQDPAGWYSCLECGRYA
jgi:hypothetical protein